MHEMGIAQSVIDIASREIVARPGARVLTVFLRVGVMSGVDSESLTFCFDCLKKETALEPARLEIERTERDELDVASVELELP
jgi:hydrogenase nickel incorporation protein HypA/HybF